MEHTRQLPKVGLVLSGGGARGLAHIGVLKVLERAGISVDVLAGASMGGLLAAAYAAGYSATALEERALELSSLRNLMKLVDLAPARRGLLEGSRVRDYIVDLLGVERSFADLRIPLILASVDLVSGSLVPLHEGLLTPAVLATIAFPGLFPPAELGQYRLVDGGVLDNLPVDLARQMGAEVIVGVDVQVNPAEELPWQDLPVRPRWPVPLPDFFLDFYRAELIMVAELTRARLREVQPEILVRPPIPPDLTMFMGFTRAREAIAAGEQAASNLLPRLQQRIQSASSMD